MGNNYHNIELFRGRSTLKHTAFNRKNPFGILPFTQIKKSFLNLDIPPPKQKGHSEPLNVLYRTVADDIYYRGFSYSLLIKILCSGCRAPPCQELQL